MNMMTLQRYKNELIILTTLLFVLFAFIYKLSADTYVNDNRSLIQKQIMQISTITALKEQWGGNGLANKVKVFKTLVPASKVTLFQKKSKKLMASYKNLTGNELSKVTNKLINMPVQIVLLNINQSAKNQYTMEFTCKW
ncbi:MAG: Unknown protein [uncultured Sulfurovum sp.]|uniref:Uncharacterized protein n=1 Tax=uncultured Sulfurovum sp. TaxID=269237 RepID=A0A6S6U1N1_9BACT|nr:MAG: Unknown protein [uncultured Sulfurovum sp.]